MDEVLLRGGIDGLVCFRKSLDGIILLAGFHQIRDPADLGLHACFERLSTDPTNFGLTGGLDGGLEDGHRSEGRVGMGLDGVK